MTETQWCKALNAYMRRNKLSEFQREALKQCCQCHAKTIATMKDVTELHELLDGVLEHPVVFAVALDPLQLGIVLPIGELDTETTEKLDVIFKSTLVAIRACLLGMGINILSGYDKKSENPDGRNN